MERQGRDLIGGFVGAAAALMLFGWLSREVLRHQTIVFDAAVRNRVHALASPALTRAFRLITWLGSIWFLFPLGAVAAWRLAAAGRRRAALVFGIAAAGAVALDQILKLAFHRPRPAVFFGLEEPSSYSFPSGHSMLSACFFGVLAALLTAGMKPGARRAGVWVGAVALALAIGISRIYLGMHYPSDVLGGYAAAVIWVAAVRAGYRVWRRARTSDPGSGIREGDGPDAATSGPR